MADNKIHITVPPEMKAALWKKAQNQYRSISEYIRDLIRKDLNNG